MLKNLCHIVNRQCEMYLTSSESSFLHSQAVKHNESMSEPNLNPYKGFLSYYLIFGISELSSSLVNTGNQGHTKLTLKHCAINSPTNSITNGSRKLKKY